MQNHILYIITLYWIIILYVLLLHHGHTHIWLYNPLEMMLHVEYDHKQSWWLTPNSSIWEHLNRMKEQKRGGGGGGGGEGRPAEQGALYNESFPCDSSYFTGLSVAWGGPGLMFAEWHTVLSECQDVNVRMLEFFSSIITKESTV